MDFFTELEIFCNAQQNDNNNKIMEISPFDQGLVGFNWAPQLPYKRKQLCFNNEFTDVENFSYDFTLPPLDEEDSEFYHKPLNIVMPYERGFGEASNLVKKEEEEREENQKMQPLPLPLPSSERKKKRSATATLDFDEIKKHFGVPITVAAKKMNVGLTLLKRRCRELNIRRWPHRKLKSLKSLIDNVKELGLANEVAMLEKHKKMLEKLPGMELNEETKKLRQACFKANYKRRRFMTLQAA